MLNYKKTGCQVAKIVVIEFEKRGVISFFENATFQLTYESQFPPNNCVTPTFVFPSNVTYLEAIVEQHVTVLRCTLPNLWEQKYQECCPKIRGETRVKLTV